MKLCVSDRRRSAACYRRPLSKPHQLSHPPFVVIPTRAAIDAPGLSLHNVPDKLVAGPTSTILPVRAYRVLHRTHLLPTGWPLVLNHGEAHEGLDRRAFLNHVARNGIRLLPARPAVQVPSLSMEEVHEDNIAVRANAILFHSA